MLRPVPSTAVRTIARRNAQAVAARLGLKFVSRRAVVLGEPDCPYEIRWNAPDFWFGINISDTSFIVRGNHKQRFATEARFLASLNSAYPTMATTMRLESLSRQLGVSVFIATTTHGPTTAAALTSDETRTRIDQLDFTALRLVFLNTVQVFAISNLLTADHCAQQATTLRELLFALFHWSLQA